MNLELNSFTIDVIFLFFCFFFIIAGYFKGFIKRFYDLIGTILSILLSYYLHGHLSNIYSFIPENNLTMNNAFLPIFNNIICFVLLFIFFYILKKIIGLIVKPLLEKIINFLSITGLINKLLGMTLGFIESLIISYFVLLLFMTPIINNGYQLINDTIIAKEVLKIIPKYSGYVIDWSTQYTDVLEKNIYYSCEDTADFILSSYKMGILSDEHIREIIDNSQINEELRIEIKKKVSD